MSKERLQSVSTSTSLSSTLLKSDSAKLNTAVSTHQAVTKLIRNIIPSIEYFHLPPRTYIVALIQDPFDDDFKHSGSYKVSNHGLVNIESEVELHKKSRYKYPSIKNVIKPKQTKFIDVSSNFHYTSLKIINRSFRDIAIFSAKGGLICHNLTNFICQLPTENIKRPKEIVNFHILPLTSVVGMIQPSGYQIFAKPGNYTVTNNGRANIVVEVFNDHSDSEEDETFFNDIIKPNETRVIKIDEGFGSTSLKISNYNVKDIAIFSAKGGYVVNDFWHRVNKLKLPQINIFQCSYSEAAQF